MGWLDPFPDYGRREQYPGVFTNRARGYDARGRSVCHPQKDLYVPLWF
jgi:hypothetical protein